MRIFLLFLLIYTSKDTLLFGTSVEEVFNFIYFASIAISSTLLFYNICFKEKSHKNIFFEFAFISAWLILGSVANIAFSGGYIVQISVILVSYLFVMRVNYQKFALDYIRIMYVTSILSLIYVLIPYSIRENFPIIVNSANETYNTIGIAASLNEESYIRNQAYFREPGVFAIYLAFALIINQTIASTKSSLRTIIFTVALISTQSTIGYITAGLLYIFAKKNNHFKSKVFYLCFFGAFAFLYQYFDLTDYVTYIFDKFDNESAGYGSFNSRLLSLKIGMEVFISNPIFGVGFKNYPTLFNEIALSKYGLDIQSEGMNSNSFASILAIYGFIPFLVFVIGLYKSSKFWSSRFYCNIPFVVIILMLSTQDMRFSSFIFLFVFYGYAYKFESNEYNITLRMPLDVNTH